MGKDKKSGVPEDCNVTIIPDEGLWNLSPASYQLQEPGQKREESQGIVFNLEETLRKASISRSAAPQISRLLDAQAVEQPNHQPLSGEHRIHSTVPPDLAPPELSEGQILHPNTQTVDSGLSYIHVPTSNPTEGRQIAREAPKQSIPKGLRRLYDIALNDESAYIDTFESQHLRCLGCGSTDHFFATCPDRQCSYCNMQDHWTKHCPKQPGGIINQPLAKDNKQTVQERADRFAVGACEKCGEPGHRELWCPHNASEASDADTSHVAAGEKSLKKAFHESGIPNNPSGNVGPGQTQKLSEAYSLGYDAIEEAIAKSNGSYWNYY